MVKWIARKKQNLHTCIPVSSSTTEVYLFRPVLRPVLGPWLPVFSLLTTVWFYVTDSDLRDIILEWYIKACAFVEFVAKDFLKYQTARTFGQFLMSCLQLANLDLHSDVAVQS